MAKIAPYPLRTFVSHVESGILPVKRAGSKPMAGKIENSIGTMTRINNRAYTITIMGSPFLAGLVVIPAR